MAKSRSSRKRRPGRGQGARPAAPPPISRLWLALLAALLLSVLANFFIEPEGHFGIDGSFGFYAWFGFLACFGLVVAGKILGVFLRREEGYYDEAGDAGAVPPADRSAGGKGAP